MLHFPLAILALFNLLMFFILVTKLFSARQNAAARWFAMSKYFELLVSNCTWNQVMFTAHLFKSAWSNRTPRGSIISQGKVTCSSSTLRSQIVSTWVVNKSNKEEKVSKLWPLQALYSKLFLVLGLTWTFEPLNELLRSQGLCAQVCSNIGVAVNAVNLLRGVAMFVIFVCKRSCLEKVSRFLQSKQTATPAGSMELQVNPDKWKRNIEDIPWPGISGKLSLNGRTTTFEFVKVRTTSKESSGQ